MNVTDRIKEIGALGEQIATADFQANGYIVLKSLRSGYDLCCMKLDNQNRILELILVEVKTNEGFNNRAKLSTIQTKLKSLSAKTHLDHMIYNVTRYQIHQSIKENRK